MGFASYDVARTGMYVSERGLNVTGHNIANISTPGFSRQQLITNDLRYITMPGLGTLGLGTDVQELRQLRDTFLDINYRKENSSLSYWSTKANNLEEVETILDEPYGNGLQSVMEDFWEGWQDLRKDPDNLTVRALVRQKATAMVNAFNDAGNQLGELQADMNQEVVDRVDQINTMAQRIADLGVEIRANELSGDKANDQRDERNLLIDKLSNLVDIDVQENKDNLLTITVGGVALVTGATIHKMAARENTIGSKYLSPTWAVSGDLVSIKSGELKACLEVRGEYAQGAIGSATDGSPDGVVNIDEKQSIPSLKERLNELFNKLTTEINNIHRSGYGLGTPAPTGIDFFTAIDSSKPLEMGNVQVNSALLDLNNIAAGTSSAKGDYSNAEKIIDLRHSKLLGDTTDPVDFDEYYKDTITWIGSKSQEASSMSENQGKLVSEIKNKKETISGVSLDEEFSNMQKYQHAYQANARVLNTIDGMVDNLINKMGR
jgi:flagellar hook-associated protein 1 FlgK